ncbi:MAG: SIR2 family protein [Bryobacteraceae bacterium]
MPTDYEQILERIEAKRAILFLGAGSTVLCRKSDGRYGLTGYGLAKEILQQLVGPKKLLGIPDERLPNLMEAAEYFQGNHPGQRTALDEFVQARLRGLQPTLGHYLATSFPWKAVVTTNYNTVAEDAWHEASNHGFCASEAIPIRSDKDIAEFAGETSKIRIYKPHGCVNHQASPERRMVLTSQDYALSEEIRGGMYKAIRSLAKSSTTVFVGYSLADYTFRNLYYRLYLDLADWSHRCYSIAPIDPPILFEWKSKAMEKMNTKLLNTTFDAFMLHLTKTRGRLHPELRKRTTSSWNSVRRANVDYLTGLTKGQFEKLPG